MPIRRSPLRPRLRVTMVLRGSVRNDPRVLKEAETLVEAGAHLCVVANKLPDEAVSVERVRPGIVAVRTTTGLVQRIRRLFGRDPATGAGAAMDGPGGAIDSAGRRRPLGMLLMLMSRFLLVLKMTGLVIRTRPDVIHCHDFNTLATGWLAARYCRARLVYDAHEVNLSREGYYRQLRPLVAAMERFLIRRCDAVITTTGLRARHFRRVYGLQETPAVLQNRPVHAEEPEPADLRRRFGIPRDALLLLYQGGLQQGRGLRNLIDALAEVDGAHLVLVGDGRQKQLLVNAVDERKLGARVHFHPKVPYAELPAVTAGADIGVQVIRNTCFNHWSTDSNKLFEYVQAGLGVLASDFPEIRRVVQAHRLGLLVDPADRTALVTAIRRLQAEPALVAELRRNARRAARALSWETQAPALLSVYPELKQVSDEASEPPRAVA